MAADKSPFKPNHTSNNHDDDGDNDDDGETEFDDMSLDLEGACACCRSCQCKQGCACRGGGLGPIIPQVNHYNNTAPFPSQPIDIRGDLAGLVPLAESPDRTFDLGNNSIEAAHPLTRANMAQHNARSYTDDNRREHLHSYLGIEDVPFIVITTTTAAGVAATVQHDTPDYGHDDDNTDANMMPPGSMDEQPLEDSTKINRKLSGDQKSMLTDYGCLFPRSNVKAAGGGRSAAAAAVYATRNFVGDPLPLLPRCRHGHTGAQVRGCGCPRIC